MKSTAFTDVAPASASAGGVGPAAFVLPEADRAVVDRALDTLAERQRALGAELEARDRALREAKKKVKLARREYQALLGWLASKYLGGAGGAPGRFVYKPESGAFVREE